MSYIEKVNETVRNISAEMKSMALAIHADPEIGLKEYHACALQKEILEKHGFSVETGFCGFETAYRACYKGAKPGPKIAMLAEYDALPGVGHGCGHNLIAMVAVGAGIAMRGFADELGGEIYVIGCPAEENAGCKVDMAKMGAFNDMDVAMMSHPAGVDAESMNTLAALNATFDFYGKPAHAAACPQEGINALDAVINCFNMINALRQQTREDARIHGIITKGGEASNVIPAHTQALLCARAAKMDYAEELFEKVRNCARGAALGTGCRLEITPGPELPDTNSNKALTALNTRNMAAMGVKLMPAGDKPMPGSSDMGAVTYYVPGIQTMFGIISGGPAPAAHSTEFAAAACTDYALERALVTIKGHVLTAIDIMSDPENLEHIRNEFAKISRRPA